MSRRIAPGAFCLSGLAVLFLLAPAAAQQPETPDGKAALQRHRQLRALLKESVDLPDFQVPLSFNDALRLIQHTLDDAHKAKNVLPIRVDAEALLAEGDQSDMPVNFPPSPRRQSVAGALRFLLAQLPSRNAMFLLRGGAVEITTARGASPKRLLQKRYLLTFEKRPLAEVVEELSVLGGVNVIVDVRIADKVKAPVTASFSNGVSVEGALRLLADMASLKVFLTEEAAYVTSAANAQALEKEQWGRQEEERRRAWRDLNPLPLEDPPPAPSAPPRSGKKEKASAALPGISTGVAVIEPPVLREMIDTKPLQAGTTLDKVFDLVRRVLKEKGKGARLVVNEAAFAEANPDAPDIKETPVKLPADVQQLPLLDLLRLAISRIPTNDAACFWRQGVLEVTIVERATVEALLSHTVRAKFERRPLSEALKALAELGGVTLVLDPRCARRAEFAVSGDFRHGVRLQNALYLLTNMAALETVTVENVVYVTSPLNARRIREERAPALPAGVRAFPWAANPAGVERIPAAQPGVYYPLFGKREMKEAP